MNAQQKIEDLREELRHHNYDYYVLDNPTITDYEFDIKLKELQALEEEGKMRTALLGKPVPQALSADLRVGQE